MFLVFWAGIQYFLDFTVLEIVTCDEKMIATRPNGQKQHRHVKMDSPM